MSKTRGTACLATTVKASEIDLMTTEQLKQKVIDFQREIYRLQKDRAELKNQLQRKSAIIEHLQDSGTRKIVEAVQRLLPL